MPPSQHEGEHSSESVQQTQQQDATHMLREGGNWLRRVITRRTSVPRAEDVRRKVPAEVQRRLTQVGKRYFFPDGEEAFFDRGRRLTTHSENSALVKLLIEIARTRQWRRIEVSGSRPFRQRAWQVAAQAGVEVEGYRPTRFERAKLAQHSAQATASGREVAPRVGNSTSRAVPREASSPRASFPSSSAGQRKRGEDELIVGRLIAHGPERYQFRSNEAMSYHVKLQTDRGMRVLWGKDLARAVLTSVTQVGVGDVVGMRRVGREAVTLLNQQRDAEGKVVAQREQQAHRNRWLVEKVSFFTEQARLARQARDRSVEERAAVRANPELASTFATLHAAADFAAKRIQHPADREKFMEMLKTRLESIDKEQKDGRAGGSERGVRDHQRGRTR